MKKQHIQLLDADYKFLQDLMAKGTLKVRKQKRALALLELHKGKTFKEVAGLLNVSHQVVSNWAGKYKEKGLQFLDDGARSGRPLGFTVTDQAKIVALACSSRPDGYGKWSLRLLADKAVELELVESISFKQVGIILKKTNYNHTERDNGASDK